MSLSAYVNAYNTNILIQNKIEVHNVMTCGILSENIIRSPGWIKLIECYPEIKIHRPDPAQACTRWCQDPTVCYVQLPKDHHWNWIQNERGQYLELYRENTLVFSYYYGMNKYGS